MKTLSVPERLEAIHALLAEHGPQTLPQLHQAFRDTQPHFFTGERIIFSAAQLYRSLLALEKAGRAARVIFTTRTQVWHVSE